MVRHFYVRHFQRPLAVTECSGATGTNLKVCGGHTSGKNCRAPPLFCSTNTISGFGERFCDGQYSY